MRRPPSWVNDMEALRSFWALFLLRAGERRYVLGNKYSRWRVVGAADLNAALYVTDHSVGIFLRGPRGERAAATAVRLGRNLERLAEQLEVPPGTDFLLARRWPLDTSDTGRWPEMADWLHAAGDRVVDLAGQVLADEQRIAA